MRCWLTTHYPHYPDDNAEWFIYVPRGLEKAVENFSEGDRVAIYEVKSGPGRLGKTAKRPSGRQAVVCLATGTGVPRNTTFSEAYVNNKHTDFVLECPCHDPQFGHALPLSEVNQVLGLSEKNVFRGRRLMEIPPERFAELEHRWKLAADD